MDTNGQVVYVARQVGFNVLGTNAPLRSDPAGTQFLAVDLAPDSLFADTEKLGSLGHAQQVFGGLRCSQ